MLIKVRELEEGEGLIWRDLRLRALTESPDAFAVTYESDVRLSDDAWREMIDATASDPSATSLIAEASGEPIGMAYCRLDTHDRSLGQIFAMWVEPRYRGQGVGRALLDAALMWMRERQATTSELTVTETNRQAIQLYESAGYIDAGKREPLREGSDLEVIRMTRDLEDGPIV